MRRSLTGQLFLRVTPIVVMMLILTVIVAFISCRREINHVYDIQMSNDANVLWSLVQDELSEARAKESSGEKSKPIEYTGSNKNIPVWNDDDDDYGNARMFRIWYGDRVIMQSDTALPDIIQRQKQGFSTVTFEGTRWRIFTLVQNGGAASIEVGEKQELRNTLVRNILIDLFLPLLLAVPLVGLGLWAGIRRGLNPIRALVRQIQRRSPDDLTAVAAGELPRDLKPLGKSINRLFDKLSHSLTAERRFADHAAHQLRTPLAGSRLLIQMLTNADSDDERKTILTDLAESNDRAAELIQKLLIAARVSHQPVSLQPIQLYPVVARVIANLARMAEQKKLTLSLEGDEKLTTLADETLLPLMITNVIDNAIKYAPPTSAITVTLHAIDDECRLSVTDQGPGIPESERALVFQRFYRADVAASEGTGLGLAIVADIVNRFNGSIELQSNPSGPGLCVVIDLPRI